MKFAFYLPVSLNVHNSYTWTHSEYLASSSASLVILFLLWNFLLFSHFLFGFGLKMQLFQMFKCNCACWILCAALSGYMVNKVNWIAYQTMWITFIVDVDGHCSAGFLTFQHFIVAFLSLPPLSLSFSLSHTTFNVRHTIQVN